MHNALKTCVYLVDVVIMSMQSSVAINVVAFLCFTIVAIA